MTGPELGFLVLGLLVGGAAGGLLATFRRGRPRTARGVKVTVAPDAIPRRRSVTLADSALSSAASPARGGPADHGDTPAGGAPGPHDPRTSVLSPPPAVPTPAAGAGAAAPAGGARMVPVPMGGGIDPLLDALRGPRTRAGTAVLDRAAAELPTDGEPAAGSRGTADAAAAEAPNGPCAELRSIADERCEVAARARLEGERARETLRAAQRSYDEHLSGAEAAARAADPRSVRTAKDAAQQAFRAARVRAATREAVDAAARDWLIEINRINHEARTAAAEATRRQDAARALAGSLDRLTVEADAARIAAETADEACLAARQAAADCDEAEQPVAAGASMPAMPSGAPGMPWLDEGSSRDDETTSALLAGSAPMIFRLLQGDREGLLDVVARLAGDDPDQRRQWQMALSDLVDAILATAIEGAALEFPEEHPFWGPFTMAQSRDIVAALASLGYRFDGLGGWQDGRIPSQRDLSLALGYAGLDPMRMRHWPNEGEMAELFGSVRVAAPEYLAVAAGDLTLGELVTMLGPRADRLTEVWNAWGRIRPLLLEET